MTALFSSPNENEVKFLTSSDKKEEYITHLLTLDLPGTATIFDVGANVGAFSIEIARHLGGETRVFAFEPFQDPFNHLLNNVSGLPVTCIRQAVGIDDSSLKGVYLPNYTLLSGFHVETGDKTMLEQLAGKNLDKEFDGKVEKVDCIRLDTFMNIHNISTIDVLKIDVEKAELNVLLSLGERVDDVRSVVAEVHQPNLEQFVEILNERFSSVVVSDKDLPQFCLDNTPSSWPEALNTYIVFAK